MDQERAVEATSATEFAQQLENVAVNGAGVEPLRHTATIQPRQVLLLILTLESVVQVMASSAMGLVWVKMSAVASGDTVEQVINIVQ